MTPEELRELMAPGVLELVLAHRDDDPREFALRFHGRRDLPVRAMAEQIGCMQKSAKKLSSLSGHQLLYTPLALEQASGERAASYKAGLLSGRRLIDLSGGLGVDTIFFSKRFDTVLYCERDPLLADLVSINLGVLGIGNVTVRTGDGPEILDTFADDAFDSIFVDPARREKGGRSVGLEASSPDVVRLHDRLLQKAPKVCIKASPALEFSGLERRLPCLSMVVVVSVRRECRETLLMLHRDWPKGRAPLVRAACLDGHDFVIETHGNEVAVKRVASLPGRYVYEPDPAIIRARLSARLAVELDLEFVNASVDYLTSSRLVEAFPGRVFRLVEAVAYKPGRFRAFLDHHGILAASIQRRDFPHSPDELRQKYRLRESDEAFLFFTRDAAGGLSVMYCRKP